MNPTPIAPPAFKRGRWKPGESGNPTGKRKGSVSLAAALKRCLTPENADAIAKRLIEVAASGDVQALRLVFERVDGKAGHPFFNVHIDNSDRRAISVSPQVLSEIAESRKRYEEEQSCPPSPTT